MVLLVAACSHVGSWVRYIPDGDTDTSCIHILDNVACCLYYSKWCLCLPSREACASWHDGFSHVIYVVLRYAAPYSLRAVPLLVCLVVLLIGLCPALFTSVRLCPASRGNEPGGQKTCPVV